MWNFLSSTSTTTSTKIPATAPITKAPIVSTEAQPAVIATKPASDAFKHIPTSGFPSLIQVNIIHTTVAVAGAIVVFIKIDARLSVFVAAAPLNPYHPNQRMKHPRAPSVIECPPIAFEIIVPSAFFVYLPILAPRIIAPTKAAIPPTEWITAEPAKSTKCNFCNHPFPP